MHGFCYQLIRVEASGSRDQAVALVRRPLPSRAVLHPGRGRDGEFWSEVLRCPRDFLGLRFS